MCAWTDRRMTPGARGRARPRGWRMGRGLPGTQPDQDSPPRRAHGEQPVRWPVTLEFRTCPGPFVHLSPLGLGRSHLQDGEAEVPEPVGGAVPKDSGPPERRLCGRHHHSSESLLSVSRRSFQSCPSHSTCPDTAASPPPVLPVWPHGVRPFPAGGASWTRGSSRGQSSTSEKDLAPWSLQTSTQGPARVAKDPQGERHAGAGPGVRPAPQTSSKASRRGGGRRQHRGGNALLGGRSLDGGLVTRPSL